MKRCWKLFGREFRHVHEELDKTVTMVGHPHRKDTHYLEFIMEKYVNHEWDIEECRAAIQHIIDDCGQIMVKRDWMTGLEIIEDLMSN